MGVNIDSKDIVSLLNIPKRKFLIISLAIMIFTGLILFFFFLFIDKLYLSGLKNKIGTILGMMFVISTVVFVIIILIFVFDELIKKIRIKKLKQKMETYLLKNNNKAIIGIIRGLLKEEDHTGVLQYNNGATAELVSRGIISLTSSNNPVDIGYNNEMYTNYFLQPFIIEIIENNEELRKKYKK